MANVLITGAAGFIGSHLSAAFLARGDTVIGVDNFASSNRHSVHLARLCEHDRFRFFECDITDRFAFDLKVTPRRYDLIMNFACPASPPRYQAMPVETMMTCTLGVKNVLDIAAVTRARVVHASTSEVYGDPLQSPQSEIHRGNVNSYGPRACYDEGKRAAEAICFDYTNKYGVDVRLVRIFNTYGPQMQVDDGRVITNFIKQALAHEPITVCGDGTQTRSFCYVDDLIGGITGIADLPTNPRSPVNLGNPNEFTINALVDEMKRRFDGVKVINVPLPIDDPTRRCPDIAMAHRLLGWSPTVSLADGLDATIGYFRRSR